MQPKMTIKAEEKSVSCDGEGDVIFERVYREIQ